MQITRKLFVSIIICAAILCAGCTEKPPLLAPVSPVTASSTVAGPAHLALTQSEVPQGFTIIESRAKTAADMGKLALDLGWENGYVVRFISPANGGNGEREIIQSIAIYPERTIPDMTVLAEQQDRSDSDLTYTDLKVQGLGDNARAFSGKSGARIITRPTDANPVSAGMMKNEVQAVSKKDMAEVLFYKGKTFEVIKITGPSPDTALLVDLAIEAIAKIP